jgi:hypothetical protein
MCRPFAIALLLSLSALAAGECLPFQEAPHHIGADTCVRGKVLNIGHSSRGSLFLNFCRDYLKCPFTVVVFPSRLRDVGDVRQLEGKEIEIHGRLQQWHGRAEIILRDARQLKGENAKLPPIPKTYDVERKGSFSAGEFKKKKTTDKKE